MGDWWSYRPSDFLMFSPRVYGRLFELVNATWWPLQGLLLGAGLAGLLALVRGRGWRATGLGLGAAWLLCALVFVHQRYLPILWAVAALLPALVGLGGLLPLLGWRAAADPASTPPGRWARPAALALGVWAVGLHPLLAPLSGHGWAQAEVLGLAPDATAIATLAWLVALPRPAHRGWQAMAWLAWGLVLAWCLFNGFMLATMERAQVGALGVAVVVAAVGRWRR
ncbi:DUF6064 family protein [Pseudaquabacterium pictum]|uniref:MFS transporter permease n=1 Tax=Pseudaquabacterium pictum TaxID=2315236 RepID=A0A480ALM8_9BURK|nr:DUF6064 family protein [Rubrivivax pictus]GCL61307.1 hypothetical protein AQPW35_03880 [Rubrivivax pictus]